MAAVVKSSFQLRKYQQEAIDAVKNAISRGVNRSAVVMATGGGKTVVFSHLIPLIRPSSANRGNRTLILAHKEELINQAAITVQRVCPHLKVGIDRSKLKPSDDCDVIVASVPTLVRMTRLQKYNASEFKMIILDECHHAMANSWIKILKYFGADTKELPIYVLGFTATLERNDGQALGDVFDEIVFERSLLEMVRNKELVDVKFSTLKLNVDLTRVKSKGDDYDIDSLSEVMNTDDVNLLVALSYLKLRKEHSFKCTLVFCVNISHCKTLCGVLQSHGINAQYVTGETSKFERRDIIEDFKNGKIDVLCNVLVFTEGTDIPNIDSLILARPTRSRLLLAQMIGRGLRLHKGKELCHVIDIASNVSGNMQSVPTLFALPSDYDIDGKNFEKLTDEKIVYDEEELLRKEAERRAQEMVVQNDLDKLTKHMEQLKLHFTTYDGFMSLPGQTPAELTTNQIINKAIFESPQYWVRLEYDLWGSQLENSFILLKRLKRNNKTYFNLSLNEFASAGSIAASKFRVKRTHLSREFIEDPDIHVVLSNARSIDLKNRYGSSGTITAKQFQLLLGKMEAKLRQFYDVTPELAAKLPEELKKISKQTASGLIFSFKYSAKSLNIRWQLSKMVGPDKLTKKRIKEAA